MELIHDCGTGFVSELGREVFFSGLTLKHLRTAAHLDILNIMSSNTELICLLRGY